jgi:uncharacterized protein (DUF58 family)
VPSTLEYQTSKPFWKRSRPWSGVAAFVSARVQTSLTRMGWYYLMMVGFVFVATVNTGVNVLYFSLGMMLGGIVVSWVVGGMSLKKIRVTRDATEFVAAGETTDVIYHFRNEAKRLPGVGVRFREMHQSLAQTPQGTVVHLPTQGKEDVTVAAPFRAAQRGVVVLEALQLSTRFPFGIFERRRVVEMRQEMVVYPRIGVLNRRLALDFRESIESGSLVSNRRGGNDEFIGVREYRPGDNRRAIHWKSSARQGQLMIREMSSNAPPQLVVVLNLREQSVTAEGRAAVERAIELATALICFGYFQNFAVGLAVAGLGEAEENDATPLMGREARTQMLQKLARLDPAMIRNNVGIGWPRRVANRAQWVVVTLHGSDPVSDLLPAGSGGAAATVPANGESPRSVLALDAPDAGTWVEFLSAADTLRLLREREA